MSLENVQLPAFAIAGLYKNTLIEEQEIPAPMAIKAEKTEKAEKTPVPEKTALQSDGPAAGYRFLGKNARNICILVNFPGEPFIPDGHLQFLTKMLDACKLNLGDVAILNIASAPVDIELLKNQLLPKYVLLFGVDTELVKLPFRFPLFKEQQYAGSQYLFTPALEELNVDSDEVKLLKSNLWVCLIKLFNV